MELKDIIKSQRLKYDLTLKDVADICGVSEGTVSRWESGEINDMRRSKIVSLAKALHVSPSVLMGWEEYKDGTDTAIAEGYYNNLLNMETISLIQAYYRASPEIRDAVRKILGAND